MFGGHGCRIRRSRCRKKLELVLDIAPEVPRQLIGDAGRLRQILVNLVGNAVKFAKSGEVVVRAAVRSHDGEAVELLFEVSDTGVGIAAEKHKIIFEFFQQADGFTTREYGGSGLGLAICSQLVRLMGGTIWLDSSPEKGSRFFFTLLEKRRRRARSRSKDSATSVGSSIAEGDRPGAAKESNGRRSRITTGTDPRV